MILFLQKIMPHIIFQRFMRFFLLIDTIAITWLALTPNPPIGSSVDIFNHLVAFVSLSGLLAVGFPAISVGHRFFIIIFYGAAIELIQYFVGRDASLKDLCVDMVGFYLAEFIYSMIKNKSGIKND
jgi:hypothetical protein